MLLKVIKRQNGNKVGSMCALNLLKTKSIAKGSDNLLHTIKGRLIDCFILDDDEY